MSQTDKVMDFRQYSRSIIVPAADDNIYAWDCIFSDVSGFAEFFDQTQNLFQDKTNTDISCDDGWLFTGIIDGWNKGETPEQVAQDLADGYCEAQYEDYISGFYSY
jgi:hypothetical protein